MSRPARILAVTAGLVAAGALFGALAAMVAFAVALGVKGEIEAVFDAGFMLMIGGVGAFLGGILLPVACWVLLRRVPLGLAVLGTVTGTMASAALGWALTTGSDRFAGTFGGALAGFAAAALLLRLFASAPRVTRGAAA